jgi:hypothetical protein
MLHEELSFGSAFFGYILIHDHLLEAQARLKIFNNSVRTSKKTPHLSIKKISLLMLFEGIIAVYSVSHTKYIVAYY